MGILQKISLASLLSLVVLGCSPSPPLRVPPADQITTDPPVTASPSPSPSPSPTPQSPNRPAPRPPAQPSRPRPEPAPPPPVVEWRRCDSLGRAYSTRVTLETANYFVNICQRGQGQDLTYFGQDRYDRQRNIRLPATSTERGYQAVSGNTTYRVQQNNAGRWELVVLQNGQRILREVARVAYSSPYQPQEPGSVTLICRGNIGQMVRYIVRYSDEHGFSQVRIENRNTGQTIATGDVDYVGQNDQGNPVFKGNAGQADFTVVGLQVPMQRGGEVSASYDGQWGRGRCN